MSRGVSRTLRPGLDGLSITALALEIGSIPEISGRPESVRLEVDRARARPATPAASVPLRSARARSGNPVSLLLFSSGDDDR
jgi:hypothetical protein